MRIPAFLKTSGLKWLGRKMFPRQYWRHKFNRLAAATAESEMSLVPLLCDRNKTSVDIGASEGVFSVIMSPVSRDILAFEPRPGQREALEAMFASVGESVRVEPVALSDRVGVSPMRILLEDTGRSTIEPENLLEDEDGSGRAEIDVELRRLDDYALDAVGMIKIDVEGHELAVLRGAHDTIERERPVVLVESENRHRRDAVANVALFFRELGYVGFFLDAPSLRPIDEFRVETHQNEANIGGWKSGWERRGVYINNFFFAPPERKNQLVEAAKKAGNFHLRPSEPTAAPAEA